MYEVSVFMPGGEYETLRFDFPPGISDEGRILLNYPEGCWIDISRAPDDGACDSLNFQDGVEYELEPYEEILK